MVSCGQVQGFDVMEPAQRRCEERFQVFEVGERPVYYAVPVDLIAPVSAKIARRYFYPRCPHQRRQTA